MQSQTQHKPSDTGLALRFHWMKSPSWMVIQNQNMPIWFFSPQQQTRLVFFLLERTLLSFDLLLKKIILIFLGLFTFCNKMKLLYTVNSILNVINLIIFTIRIKLRLVFSINLLNNKERHSLISYLVDGCPARWLFTNSWNMCSGSQSFGWERIRIILCSDAQIKLIRFEINKQFMHLELIEVSEISHGYCITSHWLSSDLITFNTRSQLEYSFPREVI